MDTVVRQPAYSLAGGAAVFLVHHRCGAPSGLSLGFPAEAPTFIRVKSVRM